MTSTDTLPPSRILPLLSAQNLRDMGGYCRADGRAVRWRTLFRSGQMARLTDADAQAMTRLGITTICDLRDNQERATHPTRWHLETPAELWARDHDHGTGDLSAIVADPQATAEDMRAAMIGIYRALPEAQADSYRTLLRRLCDGRVPVLFNCSAGKDRTGFAAALILRLLDVAEADIEADYLASNMAMDGLARHLSSAPRFRRLMESDPDVAKPLLHVEPAYLAASFETITAAYGSLEGYARERLGLDSSDLASLADTLLDPA